MVDDQHYRLATIAAYLQREAGSDFAGCSTVILIDDGCICQWVGTRLVTVRSNGEWVISEPSGNLKEDGHRVYRNLTIEGLFLEKQHGRDND